MLPNESGIKNPIGYVILMVGKEICANTIQYSSCRCHRVSRLVTADKVHAFVHATELGTLARETLSQLINRAVEMKAYVDSRTLSNIISKKMGSVEYHWQIDVFTLKKTYQKGKLKGKGCVPGKENVADVLTKKIASEQTTV